MDSILFGLIQLAVAWLVAWCCVDRSKADTNWWPFDIRSTDKDASVSDATEPNAGLRRYRQAPTRPWKRSGS